jgi:phenylalanyl-tRNA synthetase beta chain
MKFSYRELEKYFAEALPPVETVVEAMTMHSSEVEEVIPHGDDWELDVKVLPDRATDAKNPLGLARELSSVLNRPLKDNFILATTAENSRTKILFTVIEINNILGTTLTSEQIIGYLNRVRVIVSVEGERLQAFVPSERLDLNIKEDLADEIARLHGYDNIPGQPLPPFDKKPAHNDSFVLANKVRAKLAAEGYTEVYGYTFTDHGEVAVEKPLASDKAFLRTNLADGMNKALMFNWQHVLFDKEAIKLFEIGNVFVNGQEEIHVVTGFIDKKKNLARSGEIYEKSLTDYASECELENTSDNLDQFINRNVSYKPVSVYPRIVRDIALFVPADTKEKEVEEVIKAEAGKLLVEGPVLFDEFQKGDKKSLAFRLIFQSPERTLSDDEVNQIMAQIINVLEHNSSWQVRK